MSIVTGTAALVSALSLAACTSAPSPPAEKTGATVPRTGTEAFVITQTALELHATHSIGQQERIHVDARMSSNDPGATLDVAFRVDQIGYFFHIVSVGRSSNGEEAISDGRVWSGSGAEHIVVERPRIFTADNVYSFDSLDDPALATFARDLAPTRLASALSVFVRYESALSSRMPALIEAFRLARLALVSAPAPLRLADDLAPPGMLGGDTPGLGMTCSTDIKCPSIAPFCIVASHDDPFGMCTRLCTEDSDCRVGAVLGRCIMPIDEIPGIDGYKMGCLVPCRSSSDVAHTCPGKLRCDQAGQCTPH